MADYTQLKRMRFGDVLKEIGLINEEQLQHALKYQKQNPKKRLGQCFVELGYLTEPQMLSALAKALNLQYIDISKYPVSLDAVRKIPRSIAQKYGALAIAQKGGVLVVAMNDPLNFYSIDDIKIVANMDIEIAVAEEEKISEAISFYYAETEARQAVVEMAGDNFEDAVAMEVADAEDESASMIKLLNSLLIKGHVSEASDIHIEPFEKNTIIRMRIDGMLVEYTTLPTAMHQALIARLKIMANMDIAEKRVPQDGHAKSNTGGYDLNLRVSTIPTIYGEKAVIRYLSTEREFDNKATFGMEPENASKLKRLLNMPYGIVYLTGPTGSGKTTTLYMALEYLSGRKVNISTIEDPVEKNIPNIIQMQVNNTTGVTFERGLRALLRQDPDIIMVGETRDTETAQISVRSAITGHLVLSTLHTNDALSAVSRLQDMGVEPYLLSSALNGIVAQRLVKKICPNCKTQYDPDEEERKILGGYSGKIYKGKGCYMCSNTGYKGRIAIHEILFIDKAIRSLITRRAPQDEIEKYVKQNQDFVTLRDNLVNLVTGGVTSMEELLRLTYYVE